VQACSGQIDARLLTPVVPARTTAGAEAHLDGDGRILGEDLFRSALIRERNKADRFDQGFALVTLARHGGGVLGGDIIRAAAAATRGTDLVGWLEQSLVLGLTYAEVASGTQGTASQLRARLCSTLAEQLGSDGTAALDIRWYFHEPPAGDSAGGLSAGDPLVEELRHANRRHSARDRAKRLVDLAGSSMLLVLLSPLFLLLAILVRLSSPGPVLFKQVRVGHFGKPFTMLKFRSMEPQADPAVHQQYVAAFIRTGAPAADAGGEKVFKIVNDARVTPIGRLLRRTSLDELPQLWNVFRGEMSLVGPRPPLCYELEQYRPWHWRRVLEGKPGLTGLWQVTGRSRTTFDEMVRLDIRYVRTCSLWTDLRILLATPRAVVMGKGAM
jgi:lipopolysaccharide/colanic/teichoic acid biosynthesis glycosyltransferase